MVHHISKLPVLNQIAPKNFIKDDQVRLDYKLGYLNLMKRSSLYFLLLLITYFFAGCVQFDLKKSNRDYIESHPNNKTDAKQIKKNEIEQEKAGMQTLLIYDPFSPNSPPKKPTSDLTEFPRNYHLKNYSIQLVCADDLNSRGIKKFIGKEISWIARSQNLNEQVGKSILTSNLILELLPLSPFFVWSLSFEVNHQKVEENIFNLTTKVKIYCEDSDVQN